jgi:DNA-binding XRE family transcriptional regulator
MHAKTSSAGTNARPSFVFILPSGEPLRWRTGNTPSGAAYLRHSNYSWKTGQRQVLASFFVLGDELRKTRIEAGLTQEDLAFKAGISRNYVSLLELNEKSPTVETLARICKALKVKVSTLIARTEGK